MSAEASPKPARNVPFAARPWFGFGGNGGALLAGVGLLSATAASACCVLPIALGAAGLGGTWLSTLTIFAPYRTVLRIAAILFIGAGFWIVYARRPTAVEGAACPAVPPRLTKALLWAGLIVLLIVLSADWWIPLVA